jgi:predicted signal transduction protein with EAL and GGDEF domain
LLRLAGARLKACVGANDTLSRWGGDEFVLIVHARQGSTDASEVTERCLDALRRPFIVHGRSLRLTASAGISVFPTAGVQPEMLIANADAAMYLAKGHGGDCHATYTSDLNADGERKLLLESALFSAIARDEMDLHYQPLISASSGKLIGAEALLRWTHPTLGTIAPAEFVPIAEDSGLIGQIGEWALRKACLQIADWSRRGLAPIRVCVNVSGRQVTEGLVNTVQTALQDARLEPWQLELEITETLLMRDVETNTKIINALRAIGVQISVDDFGTGYSSLAYLKGFALNTLKIDQSFVSDVTSDTHAASIVTTTINLARNLGLRTVAEGVETREQADFLIQQGADELQGFLFARAMASADFLTFALAAHSYLLPKKVTA